MLVKDPERLQASEPKPTRATTRSPIPVVHQQNSGRATISTHIHMHAGETTSILSC